MAANVDPIFSIAPQIGEAHLAAANTGADLSTNAALVFTGATNGSLLQEVRIKPVPATATVATVARLWINNNGTLSTITNNTMIDDLTIPAIAASQVAGIIAPFFTLPRGGLFVPSTYRVYVTIGTYSTGTFTITGIGSNY